MITAQFAHGHGGTYKYYRCVRKSRQCEEPYVQEVSLAAQCLGVLSPFGLNPEEASTTIKILKEMAANDDHLLSTKTEKIETRLEAIQDELNRLTRSYGRGAINDESYATTTGELIAEKNVSKRQKERLQSNHGCLWLEPAKEVVQTLELAAKQATDKSQYEISRLVRKIGTNHRISEKAVSVGHAEPYDFVATYLSPYRFSPPHSLDKPSTVSLTSSILWRLADYLRTHFSKPDAREEG